MSTPLRFGQYVALRNASPCPGWTLAIREVQSEIDVHIHRLYSIYIYTYRFYIQRERVRARYRYRNIRKPIMYFQILVTNKFLLVRLLKKKHALSIDTCCACVNASKVQQWIQLCLYWRGAKGLKSSCFFWMDDWWRSITTGCNAWVFIFHHCICERWIWIIIAGCYDYWICIILLDLCWHVTLQIEGCQSDLPLMSSIFHGMIYTKGFWKSFRWCFMFTPIHTYTYTCVYIYICVCTRCVQVSIEV